MTEHAPQHESPVFTLLPPHYHNGWVYKLLIKELREKGYQSHAPHLEISDPELTRDDHAAAVEEAEESLGAESYIRVGASWGADLIYRRIGESVSKLVFMGAPLRPIINRSEIPSLTEKLANTPNLTYAAYVAGEEEFNRQELGEVFYRNLGDLAVKEWAISQLEPHPHEPVSIGEDQNAVLPTGVGLHYVGFLNDKILSFDKQADTARFFDIDFTPFPSGHFAMLEKPRLLAELLAQLAKGKVERRAWPLLQRGDQLQELPNSSETFSPASYYEL